MIGYVGLNVGKRRRPQIGSVLSSTTEPATSEDADSQCSITTMESGAGIFSVEFGRDVEDFCI